MIAVKRVRIDHEAPRKTRARRNLHASPRGHLPPSHGEGNHGPVTDSSYHVHFVTPGAKGPDVSPICGDWRGYFNWTTVRECVTCPFCLERLRSARA